MKALSSGSGDGIGTDQLKPWPGPAIDASIEAGPKNYFRFAAPVASDFTADDTGPVSPADVTFTPTISGQWTSGLFEVFDSAGALYGSATIEPGAEDGVVTISDADTYDVRLTVYGPGGAGIATKAGYVTAT